ncbi:5,10-methylenetetrahydromethanopterin reductase [Actinoplanes tereljensis]|uniref:5,10-methylenetetrahydromethanopterin reductase n=1 Tax=Paractinoplanes tereljensis TaxID=571912 RepID=A0A919TWU9_9ACTN|nr:LLM class flavin-dependent oxidoreductase [Actinoplanes tereljensis]GIF23257.1 5,10-methylenetetrahydromethanopterin reductase [Actinoplanes tereljensis]
MSAGLRFSIRINNDLSVDRLVGLARIADASGFDQVWVSNDLFLRSAPVLLTVLAERTERIHIGAGIFNPYSIHPAELAMLTATLQEVSGGRFRLGLAAGAAEFLNWAGIARERPLARTAEAVRDVRTLLNGERPAGWAPEGHLRFPMPAPIYLGAMSPRMLGLAGEIADGALPLLYPPEHFATARDQVQQGLDRAGRDAADFDLPACFWVSVDTDAAAAKLALAEKIAYYGAAFAPYLLSRVGLEPADFKDIRPDQVSERMLALGIAGGPEEVVERCRGLIAAGARHLSFGPPLGPDPEAAVALLADEVLPKLRGA